MEYGHLLVRGKTFAETDVSTFISADDVFEWKGEAWEAFNLAYPEISDNEGPQTDADLIGKELANKLSERYLELKEIEENAKPVKVDGVEYKRLKTIDVLHCGWESDSKAFLVETNEGNRLVMTDHGRAYFAKPEELHSKIEEYQQALKDSQDMLGMMLGSREAQEARGQQALVRESILPKIILGASVEQLAAMGFCFGTDVDELFVECKLPTGWFKRAKNHAWESELVDDKGRVRARLHYKAAFYDRKAFMIMVQRFTVHLHGKGTSDGARHASVKDGDIIILDLGEWNDYDQYNELDASACAWLNEHYPDWRDRQAYWD